MAGPFDPPIPVVQVVAVDPFGRGIKGNVRQTARKNLRPSAGYEEVYGDVSDEPRLLEEPVELVGTIALGFPVGQEPPLPPGSMFPIGTRRARAG
jgi:hypothetical protein